MHIMVKNLNNQRKALNKIGVKRDKTIFDLEEAVEGSFNLVKLSVKAFMNRKIHCDQMVADKMYQEHILEYAIDNGFVCFHD